MVMAAGILMVSVLRLADEHGVQVVGVVHPGLPVLSPPRAHFDDVLDLLPGAFAITLFILSEALGVGYSLSSKYRYDIDANQELIALGVSNVAAACLGGLVSGCSVSSTAVNDRAGAKSQVSSLAAATMVLITLVALMPFFHNLPQAILSAIVIHAVARMMRVAELKRFYRFHPSEFGLGLVALLGAITVGILPGLSIAVALSLLRFIWGASHLSSPASVQCRAGSIPMKLSVTPPPRPLFPASKSCVLMAHCFSPMPFASGMRCVFCCQAARHPGPFSSIFMPILGLICRPPIRFWAWLPRRKKPTPRSCLPSYRIRCGRCSGVPDW